MLCPAVQTQYVAKNGDSYTSNAQAIIKSVTGTDALDMVSLGCKSVAPALTVSAATDPTTTNDNTQGFSLGSLWLDQTGPTFWTATDVTTNAAVWTQLGATTNLRATFSAGLASNPVSLTTKGTCTVASVNADTCVILTGATSRTITVTHFDIVAAGSAATCTGVKLEDSNGSPVVVATLAAATLTSGAHNIPLTATLGVGYGAGTGLTSGASLQLDVNGSGCTTTTAFTYTVTYTVQ